jgi:pimeloyl-ACP methyl ester carboxylesterase
MFDVEGATPQHVAPIEPRQKFRLEIPHHAENGHQPGRSSHRAIRRYSCRGAERPIQFYKDLAVSFYGSNRPGASVSQGILDQFWLWSMQSGLKNAYESIKAFSETDFTEDLKKIDVPTLVMHGEDDQIVPVKDSAKKSAKLIRGAKEIYYRGAPHGLTATHQDQVNADLLAFISL